MSNFYERPGVSNLRFGKGFEDCYKVEIGLHGGAANDGE